MEQNEEWYGWKDIEIPIDLTGDNVTKGSGTWEKEYTYIKVPHGYGYDGYCFLLSSTCVHYGTGKDSWWFSICHDMKIELIYDPELRESGKRYKRYKLTGRELFNNIFKDYEVNFKKEYEERRKREETEKEIKDRKNIGTIVAGRYTGNVYQNKNEKYRSEYALKAYFSGNKTMTYSNKKFDKVRNIKEEFVICENISKYHFLKYEDIINAFLLDIDTHMDICNTLETRLKRKREFSNYHRSLKRVYKEFSVTTNTENIIESHIEYCKGCIEEIKQKLQERVTKLLEIETENLELEEMENEKCIKI